MAGQGKFVSEINVTPFVDVMLVLLIIFMVATPMMSQGLDIDLPQAKQAEALETESDHITLTVAKDGTLYMEEYSITNLDSLEEYLRRLVKEKDRTLFLQADKDVPYGIVVAVIGRIKSVGIEKMGIMAESVDAISAPGSK